MNNLKEWTEGKGGNLICKLIKIKPLEIMKVLGAQHMHRIEGILRC